MSLWGLKDGDVLAEETEAVPEPWVLRGAVCVSMLGLVTRNLAPAIVLVCKGAAMMLSSRYH